MFAQSGATYISEFFNCKNVPYNFRGLSTRLELPSFNLECMHRLNALPSVVREAQDIISFKRSLKAYMA